MSIIQNINTWCGEVGQLEQIVPETEESMIVTGVNMVGGLAVDFASTVGIMGAKHVVKEGCKTVARAVVGENILTPVATYVAGSVGGTIADGAIAVAKPVTQKVTSATKQVINGIAYGVKDGLDKIKYFLTGEEKPEDLYGRRITEITTHKRNNSVKATVINIVVAVIAIAAIVGLIAFPPLSAGVVAAAVIIGAIGIGTIAFTSYKAHKEFKKCTLLTKVYEAYIGHIQDPNDDTWEEVEEAVDNMETFIQA